MVKPKSNVRRTTVKNAVWTVAAAVKSGELSQADRRRLVKLLTK